MQDRTSQNLQEEQAQSPSVTIAPEEVEAELRRVLSSPTFRNAPRHCRFLSFVVCKVLAGEGGNVKEYLIGLEVFDRPSDYDPGIDPIVRAETRRLRARLAEYYGTLGECNQVRISLPKGTYVPAFYRNGVEPPLEEAELDTDSAAPPALQKEASSTAADKSRRLWLAAGAGMVVLILIAGAITVTRFVPRRPTKLTEKDSIVLADFENHTGDPVFDDTLKTALTIAFNQSPFLTVLPDNRVAATLQLMTRPATTVLTPEVSSEVCQRAGGKAYISGSIVRLGASYVLTLKAVNCRNGDLIGEEQATASSKETILVTLGQATSKLRTELGESLGSLKEFDVPLEQATTSSLEALKEYSIAYKSGATDELPHLKRAIELDPNFAMAYVGLGWYYWGRTEIGEASQYFAKAFQLREHANKLERLRITADYYTNVSGELDKAQQIYAELTAIYPGNPEIYPWNIACAEQGLYDDEIATYRSLVLRDPSHFYTADNFGTTLLAVQRFDEAGRALHDALKVNDNFLVRTGLYALAFLTKDTGSMAEQQKWYAKQGAYRTFGLALASDTELYEGRLRQAKVLTSEAEQYAMREDWNETAAIWQQNTAIGAAAVGYAKESQRLAAAALEMAPTSPAVEAEGALAFAMSGEMGKAEALAKQLNQRFPKDTQMQALWLPAIHAQVALDRKNAGVAISQLRNTGPPIEYGQIMFLNNISCLYHTYVRGQTYLAAQNGAAAAAEFQKILDHSGIVWNCWTGALAHLGLARANALQARTSQGADDGARVRALAAYKDFLTLWKDADPDIPIYRQAKAEYARLQ